MDKMSSRQKIQLVNGEIYHVVMRAIDGITLFKDSGDFLRMIHDLFEFNNLNHVSSNYRVICHRSKIFNVTSPGDVTITSENAQEKTKRKLLVEILAFCLMPNHIHLLLKQLQSNGISKFIKKFGGYSRYHNIKYKRNGHLFQGRFRAIHIEDDKQLMTAFVYIHTNPVAILYPNWKEKGIKNVKEAIKFNENYRWSSYPNYLGKKNFPSLTSREFLLELIEGSKNCRQFVEDWLYLKRKLSDFKIVAIE